MGRITMLATAAALSVLLVAPSNTYAYVANTQPDEAPEYRTVSNDHSSAWNTRPNRLCYNNALAWLAEWPIPVHCTSRIAHQASAFCASYLYIAWMTTTVFNTATITSKTTATATQTLTSITTEVITTTLTTQTTSTSVSTTTTTSPTSTVTTTSIKFPTPDNNAAAYPHLLQARQAQAGYPGHNRSCPDLTRKRLQYRPQVLLNFACACLGIYANPDTEKQTYTSTLKLTSRTTTTETIPKTSTKTTTRTTTSTSPTTTTQTTTTTSTSTSTIPSGVATTTAAVSYCDISYNGGGITQGNTVLRPEGSENLSGRECCLLCFTTPNCVASAVGLGYCQLLLKNELLAGAVTSNQCLLGIEAYPFQPGPGTLYLGPCGVGSGTGY